MKKLLLICILISSTYVLFSQIDTSQMRILISTALVEKDNMIVFYKKNNIPKVLKKKFE